MAGSKINSSMALFLGGALVGMTMAMTIKPKKTAKKTAVKKRKFRLTSALDTSASEEDWPYYICYGCHSYVERSSFLASRFLREHKGCRAVGDYGKPSPMLGSSLFVRAASRGTNRWQPAYCPVEELAAAGLEE